MDPSLLFLLALGLSSLGLLGIFIPGVPGIPLMWLAIVGYAILDHLQHLGWLEFLVLNLLAAAGTTAGYWSTRLGARAGGGSAAAALAGSCLVTLGLVFFTLPLALLAAVAGVFGLEWRRQHSAKSAARGSAGWLAGWALSLLLEFSLAVAILLGFAWTVLVHAVPAR